MQAVFLVWFSFVFPKVREKTIGEGGGGRGKGGGERKKAEQGAKKVRLTACHSGKRSS